jgi:hypothetical protein
MLLVPTSDRTQGFLDLGAATNQVSESADQLWFPPNVLVRLCRTSATVRDRPALSGTCALKPNDRLALLMSRHRLGCPLGLDLSHSIRPEYPVSSEISCASSFMLTSLPDPRLTGSLLLYDSAA